ncbi:MAG: TetR/AcrR family transcriptional regulator [Granulosicoccaceae bacterium]
MNDTLHPLVKIDENSTARERILATAFDEMYEHGFQGLRIDRILEKTQLTKGAMYHHFSSKKVLGYAIVDEILQGWVSKLWTSPSTSEDPISSYQKSLRANFASMSPADFSKGCPVNNLVQEMAGLDEGFQTRLNAIYENWKHSTEAALKQGQSKGTVRSDINVEAVSIFIISSIQGLIGMVKCSQCCDPGLEPVVEELCNYLEIQRA